MPYSANAATADRGQRRASFQRADAALRRFGRIDVVCNNAGVVAGGPAWTIDLEDWRRVIDIDLWGVVNGIRTFVPILLTQPGPTHVVNVAWMAGVTSLAGNAPYVVAKHGVVVTHQGSEREVRSRLEAIISENVEGERN